METTLFDPTVDSDIFASGFIEYAQIPTFPAYPEPPFNFDTTVYAPIPNLSVVSNIPDIFGVLPDGTSLNTDGRIFNNLPGYNVLDVLDSGGDFSDLSLTERFSADANTGYAGFTNYTINTDDIDLDELSLLDLLNIGDLLVLEPVNPNFPKLDATAGFTIAFDLTILQEASAANRAGFSIVAVTEDPSQEIEIGFKTAGADRVFALSENFVEAENSSGTALNLGQTQTFWLSMVGDRYSLASNGVEILSGPLRDYNFVPIQSDPPLPESANPYEIPSFVFLGDNTDQANAIFTLGKISILPPQIGLTDPLVDDYIATHPDLISALGYNLIAAKDHYRQFGFEEGRAIDEFAADIYLASYGDLISAFGYDLAAATRHYIENGAPEGRAARRFIPEVYLDSYEDLRRAFGNDRQAATRHYIETGFNEGRDPFAAFNGGAYIASYDDLIAAFGNNPAAGLPHYLQSGAQEGRTMTFEADDYIASYDDLILAFGYDLDAGISHFISLGSQENRSRDSFDEVAYLNNYLDLQQAFGNDVEAATRHYILHGFAEGRSV